MTNTALNRTLVEVKTNKSGGAHAQGDVCVEDTSNANAVVNDTAGAFVDGMIWVCIEPAGVADSAQGLYACSGYVPKINLSGSASLGDLVSTHTVAKQGVRHAAPMVAGDFAQVLGTGTSPAATLFAVKPTGSSGGGYSEGTSFPISPSTDDKYYRTDRNLLYYYDGTRWLTTTLYEHHCGHFNNVSSDISAHTAVWTADYDVYVVDLVATMYAASGLSGTAYWRFDLYFYAGATRGSVIATVNNQSGTNVTFERKKASINALMGTGKTAIDLSIIKVSTPGNFYGAGFLTYRLVG